MTTETNEEQAPAPAGKGKQFFTRADQVAETGNWDFAIQMYLEGIRREPENLERGHVPLRKVALVRKAQGGKAAGRVEQLKRRSGKDPMDSLVNAEYLLAKDPGKVEYMMAVLRAAEKAGVPQAVSWVGDIVLEAMRQAKRPSKRTLIVLAEAFVSAGVPARAVRACDLAIRSYPNDGDLHEMAKNYSAMATITEGEYDTEGSFTKSVRDMDRQKELSQRDQLAQSREFLEQEIARTRAEYEASPEVAGKVDALADALLKIEEEAFENEAIDVLDKAHADSKAYRFKVRMDDVRMRQIRRRYNKLRSAGDKQRTTECARELLAFELEVYADRAKNYPTDLSIKYELGRRQLTAGEIDKAIASLQQAQREPKWRIRALCYLGQAFAKKDWPEEAVDTYQRALQLEPPEAYLKEIHYNLGQVLRTMGQTKEALEHFSQVAQMDYNYQDVREQIEELRKKAD